MKTNHPCAQLAKKAVKKYLASGSFLNCKDLELPSWARNKKAGVFVTIYQRGQLRGCIGTPTPIRNCIADEIVGNAVAAATQDPRFVNVSIEELNGLEFEVSVLDKPKKIKSKTELDAKKYGVLVKAPDGRSGLLLPDIPGIDNPKDQVIIAAEKGGIFPGEEYEILKFSVSKYS